MDFDGDGDSDVLSGSFPGGLYLFRRGGDGSFEKGEKLKHSDGTEIKTGSASTVFAVDWDADGDLDLITGNIQGQVHLVPNERSESEPAYGKPVKLDVDKDLQNRRGDSGAIVADWNHDGLHDLLVAMGDGSVLWFKNTGTAGKPKLARGEQLVAKSKFGFDLANARPDEGQWGARVKVHAVDFNGDGRLDLLLGDRSGAPAGEVSLSDEQRQAAEEAKKRLPEVRKQLTEARTRLQRLSGEEREEAQQDYLELSREYSKVVQTARRTQPKTVRHGFVWLFERKVGEKVARR